MKNEFIEEYVKLCKQYGYYIVCEDPGCGLDVENDPQKIDDWLESVTRTRDPVEGDLINMSFKRCEYCKEGSYVFKHQAESFLYCNNCNTKITKFMEYKKK